MTRPLPFWFFTLCLAIVASFAHSGDPTSLELVTNVGEDLNAMPVPEPSRAAFLGLGIIAVAATYRQAWMNMRKQDR